MRRVLSCILRSLSDTHVVITIFGTRVQNVGTHRRDMLSQFTQAQGSTKGHAINEQGLKPFGQT